jgi:hypothetical protein
MPILVGTRTAAVCLWLHKRPDNGARWFLRETIHGRRRDLGLGNVSDVSLKEARKKKAETARSFSRDGLDPIKARERHKREAPATYIN